MSKLDKLKELGELLNSNAITDTEFKALKDEILISDDSEFLQKDTFQNPPKTDLEKERIELKSFRDYDGKLIEPPKIQYINPKNILDNEMKLIKPFIRLKQIHAPDEMTQNEIALGEKLFSIAEINQMNSERSGFNYFSSLVFPLGFAILSFILFLTSPFLILLTTVINVGMIIACIVNLNKVDATKMDKRGNYIALVLIIIPIILIMTDNVKF